MTKKKTQCKALTKIGKRCKYPVFLRGYCSKHYSMHIITGKIAKTKYFKIKKPNYEKI